MTPRTQWRAFALMAFAFAAITACRPDDQRTDTVDPQGEQTRAQLPPDVVAALDSGTVAFRDERLDDALRHYTRVTELAPALPAGWFGVYMVHQRSGDLAAADSALQRARSEAPGASLIHPTAEDTIP